MEKRNFNGRDISLLGFGLMRLPRKPGNPSDIDLEASSKLVDFAIANGINYFDTAYTYDGSEAFAGCALSNYSRDTYCLATKCPPWKIKNTDDFERIFAEQLARCRTGYFDFYLVHNMAQESRRAAGNEEYFESFVRLGMHEMLKRKKAEGKIRNIGFSFHGTADLLLRLVDRYEWDFSQVQVNYIDWITTDAKRQYEILTEHNIPVVVMEPLRGGTMATLSEDAAALLKKARPGASLASWGIRYAASLPNVVTVLSGMNEMGQLKDNIATMDGFQPVTEAEKELLYEAVAVFGKSGAIPCTGCRYCMPCPSGVDIPRNFSMYNHCRLLNGFRIPFDNDYATLSEKEKASGCVACGQCLKKCPQHLSIPEYMEEIAKFAGQTE